ncbi:MAG TPA: hypothetical protein P5550_04055 [Bacteroidales bacterium]|nr:hypothetical protein [Bacteroidales bacterium]
MDRIDLYSNKVLIENHKYSEIKEYYRFKKNIRLLKLSNQSSGKSITLEFVSGNSKGIDKNEIALSSNNMTALGIQKGENVRLDINKGNSFTFYYFNQDKNLMLTFRIAIISILLSLISLFVSMFF